MNIKKEIVKSKETDILILPIQGNGELLNWIGIDINKIKEERGN